MHHFRCVRDIINQETKVKVFSCLHRLKRPISSSMFLDNDGIHCLGGRPEREVTLCHTITCSSHTIKLHTLIEEDTQCSLDIQFTNEAKLMWNDARSCGKNVVRRLRRIPLGNSVVLPSRSQM